MPKYMRNITAAKSPYCMQHARDEDSITASSVCQHRTGLEEHYNSASPLTITLETPYCLPATAFSA